MVCKFQLKLYAAIHHYLELEYLNRPLLEYGVVCIRIIVSGIF